MEPILKKITDKIRRDENQNFLDFFAQKINLERQKPPIDIIPLIEKNFFFITEVKKGSPSKGVIREKFDPVEIAEAYEKGGASAISVITEKNFFYGEKDDLRRVKERVRLPVLRKDFLIHPYQIYESYELGADFILLIAACLSQHELRELYETAQSLGMRALVEIHDAEELERALRIKPRIIGINNRNLKTFKVDCQTSFRLKELIPEDILVISESGIRSHEDIMRLKKSGFSGALIGESLLKQDDVTAALKRMMNG